MAYCDLYKNTNNQRKERQIHLPTSCMNTNKPPVPPKKNKIMDLILFLVAIYLLFTVKWGHTTSYDHLMLFLYALCVLLRISNIRKSGIREMERRKRMEQMQKQNEQETANEEDPALLQNTADSATEADSVTADEHKNNEPADTDDSAADSNSAEKN